MPIQMLYPTLKMPAAVPEAASRAEGAGVGLADGALLAAGYRDGDRLLSRLLLAHAPLVLALAPLYGTWFAALVFGGGLIAAGLLVAWAKPGSVASRMTLGAALLLMSALLIHQTHGMIETHFHIFAVLAFLLVYRDWRVVVWGATVAALHHAGFHGLQMGGAHVYVFADHMGWHIVAVHAAWVVFEASVLIYIARGLEAETRQSEELVRMAERLGAGDLTARADGGVGAVGNAVRAINTGTGRLAGVVHAIRGRAGEVLGVAEALSAASEHVTSAAEGVADSLTRVAQGAQQQARDTQRMAAALGGLVGSVDTVAERAAGVSAASEHAVTVARDGSRVIGQAVGSLERIRETVLQSAAQIEEMRELSDRVGRITGVITDMAAQTNLLALNAAIEAARAGHHGRGFAVVAAEVRVLANRSGEAAAEAAELIRGVQDATARAVDGMQHGTAEVKQGARLAEDAGRAMREIVGVVEQSLAGVGDIGTAAARIADASREALRAVGLEARGAASDADLAAVVAASEANAAGAEEAAAAVQEINAAMEEMSASAQELAGIARELEAEVARFTVTEETPSLSAAPAPAPVIHPRKPLAA
jgi:methyl-accepting chemotaxis protein